LVLAGKKTTIVKTVAVVFNLKKKGSRSDAFDEYDEIETIAALSEELSDLGLKVLRIEQSQNLAKEILQVRPDFVFNLAEGLGINRFRESQVPSILETLNIPYSGSDPLSLSIALDKYLTNIILNSAGVPVPQIYMVKDKNDLVALKKIFADKKVFIVKPRWEGSSKGIFLHSLVRNQKELKERALYMFSKYKQPAVIEEFLQNDEITVGVCGNAKPYILGIMRIRPKGNNSKFFLYSQENKKDWQRKIQYEPTNAIEPKIVKLIEKYALSAFAFLELRDVARIDFRLDSHNVAKIIDINPLPGLSPYYSDLPILCQLHNKSYSYLIRTILKEALQRYSLKVKMQKLLK
jgi:D-alanine-D-alanine ligase